MKECYHRTIEKNLIKCDLIENIQFNLLHEDNVCMRCERTWDDIPPTEQTDYHKECVQLHSFPIAPKSKAEKIEPIELREPKELSLLQKGMNYIGAQTENIINGLKEVDDETYNNRLNICTGNEELSIKTCEHYSDNHCGICGCKLKGGSGFTSKLKLPFSSCPVGKWLPVI